MAQFLFTLPFALFGTFMFLLGYLASSYVCLMLLRRTPRVPSKKTSNTSNSGDVTRDDIRAELLRDTFATELMCDDDTPDDVARYLYLEAERRARLRKQGVDVEDDTDLFSRPHDKREPFQ